MASAPPPAPPLVGVPRTVLPPVGIEGLGGTNPPPQPLAMPVPTPLGENRGLAGTGPLLAAGKGSLGMGCKGGCGKGQVLYPGSAAFATAPPGTGMHSAFIGGARFL